MIRSGKIHDLLDQYEELEKDGYIEAQRKFDRGDLKHGRFSAKKSDFQPDDANVFFTMEEFTRHREAFASAGDANLRNVYLELLERPEEPINANTQIDQALLELAGQSNFHWYSMDAYLKWIFQMYRPDVIARFGGLDVVDPGWLPIRMVSQFRQRRTKWQD